MRACWLACTQGVCKRNCHPVPFKLDMLDWSNAAESYASNYQ